MSTSRAYHHGDLRAALLATTRTVLASSGIEGLSLREVSRQAGVSHAAAYNHFRDKADLLRAVVDAAFARLAAEMRDARSATHDPFERLCRMGVAYARFAFCNPVEFKIMFRPELCSTPSAEPNEAYALLVAAIGECQRSGAIAAGASEPFVLAAWSMVHGIAALLVDGPNPDLAPDLAAAERLARQCVEVLAAGLRAPH
jgi:AcrR family transcriptional regulator